MELDLNLRVRVHELEAFLEKKVCRNSATPLTASSALWKGCQGLYALAIAL